MFEHTDIVLQNGGNKGQPILESIETKVVLLCAKNPVVRLGLVIEFEKTVKKFIKWIVRKFDIAEEDI